MPRLSAVAKGVSLLALVMAALRPVPALAGEHVAVRLNFVPGLEHSFLFLGKDKGWYEQAGIDLEVLPGQGSTVAVKTVGNGEDQFAVADAASVARGWEAGVPLVYVAMLLKETPAAIYSLESKGITTMRGLCGMHVGVNIKSTTAEQYRAMLRLSDLKNCAIDEVPINSGGAKEVLAGLVDAAVNFIYTDALQVKVRSGGVNAILASDYFHLYGLGIITNRNLIAKKPDLVKAFVRVTLNSLHYALTHKEEAVVSFRKVASDSDMTYESAKFDMFKELVLSGDPTGAALGAQDLAGWQASLKTMREIGIVKTTVDPEGRFVTPAN